MCFWLAAIIELASVSLKFCTTPFDLDANSLFFFGLENVDL